MKELSDYQMEFILNNFFKNSDYNEDVWRRVGRKLLVDGKCLVAGLEPMWRGGVGNYINTEESEDAVGCLFYTFDLKEFIEKSLWYKEVTNSYISSLSFKKGEIEREYHEIINI